MGIFDSVWFNCPNCNQEIEQQTKAHDCLLRNYSPNKVPAEIAYDLDNEEIVCYNCNFPLIIEVVIERVYKLDIRKNSESLV